ncbi:hypothetical protein NAT51_03640 [Flavobacterium amniphilum]|uniref:hypothetical protein n=1 Tax=Flavobacterium amniphilum TaxID=1834035 RepID=UPI00202AAC90|nr:hypothetical protein [Flavobacterium amniphilum]MCL9804599.1 hypothetical protein [Flavobacterium amniphilum]
MESYLYTCQYCSKEYKPNRRKKQKYCSNSCRVRSFKIRNTQTKNLPVKVSQDSEKLKIEKMSFAGIGNAALGTLAVNLATNLLSNDENKPATKKDLKNLITSLKQRYYPILNIPVRRDGAKAYFDMESKSLVYFKQK